MYYIIRNGQQYGPYQITALQQYVEAGQILLHDKAVSDTGKTDVRTVKYFLKQQNIKVKIPHKGGLFSQITDIGRELIFPQSAFQHKTWISDKRLLLLALVGLVPLGLLAIGVVGLAAEVFPFAVFYLVSLYFSVIWGLFFYYFFSTSQVKLKTTLLIFFLTQIAVFVIFGLGINNVNPFYHINDVNAGFLLRIVFFVFAVGLTEELTKAVPLWIVSSQAREPLIPQTLVFYGLISGIAFGVYEGVQYQMTVNAELNYTAAFFFNIARLTSLPFLHAIWCGIAGYFSAFAMLYPKYRRSLYFLAIAVPMVLHGLYDALGTLLGLALSFIGVVLLMTYLKTSVNYQSKLRN